MHLLATKPGGISDGSEAVDLNQSPGDIIILSAADTDLLMLSAARGRQKSQPDLPVPSLRLANIMNLTHNMSVDLYTDSIIANAKLVIIRLLGGVNYWQYGIEQIVHCCRTAAIPLVIVPGDDQPDAELTGLSSQPTEACHRLWQYFVQGGPGNADNLLRYATSLLNNNTDWQEPAPLLRAGIYWPDSGSYDLSDLQKNWIPDAPIIAITFYRALFQAGNLEPVDLMIRGLQQRGLNPLPIYVTSLKESVSAGIVKSLFDQASPDIILNATSFSVSKPNGERADSPLEYPQVPVFQVIFAGGNEEDWREGLNGLSARDIAMNVALPEVDGRIISRAVSFKAEARYDEETQLPVIAYQAVPDRINFVCDLAENWAKLARTEPENRKLGLIFANYPNRDGRLGNGVGLDTPASTLNLLNALSSAGYDVGDLPAKGDDLINKLAAGPTNNLTDRANRVGGIEYSIFEYMKFFKALPDELQTQITDRWGTPEKDPFVVDGNFVLSVIMQGNVAIGLQPARGYNIDPKSSYHDPDLVPPHGYLAFYAWLRSGFEAQAIIHMGKHGNMEWLPC